MSTLYYFFTNKSNYLTFFMKYLLILLNLIYNITTIKLWGDVYENN